MLFFLSVNVYSTGIERYSVSDSIHSSNIEEYIELGNEYVDISIDTSIIIMNKVIEVALTEEQRMLALNVLSKAYYLKSNYKKAIEINKESLIYYRSIQDDENIAKVLNRIALIYIAWGIYDNALEYLFSSITIYKEISDSVSIGKAYNNIGLTYEKLKKLKLAFTFYQKAYKVAIFIADTNKIAITTNNLGVIFIANNEMDSALYYLNKSISFKKIMNDEVGLANSYGNLSDLYYKQGDYSKSLEYLKKVHYISERNNNLEVKALVNSNLGRLYTKLEIYNLAEDYLVEAMKYAKQTQANYIILQVNKNFSELYIQTKDFEKATSYLKTYISVNEKVYSKEQLKKVTQLQVAYDMENSNKENEALKELNILNENKLDSYKNAKHYIIIMIILAMLLLIVVYSRIKNNIKNNKIINDKSDKINQINSELLEANNKLKSSIDNRTDSIKTEIEERIKKENELKSLLEKETKTNFLKDKFLSNISQEIRTPLNAISGFASLLNIKLKDENVSEYVSGIYQNSNRLLHLLNNIIDFGKIESSDLKLSSEVLSLNEIVNNVIQLYKFKINEKKLELKLDLDMPITVFADSVYISKVLNEIIDNSVRYTNEGAIKISIGELNSKEVYVKVIDTGIGIDSQYLPHVFDSFTQDVNVNTSSYKGVGLGLPLSKKFIEMNGGRIEISSKVDSGTIVNIILPINELDISSKETVGNVLITDTLFRQKEFQIFLIEDDYFNRLMLETILDNVGIVTSAAGGDEAMSLIEEKHNTGEEFDIMIIDINLPNGWDGIKLMLEIRKKWPLYNDIIFIAQTAYADNADKQRFLDNGFNEYITKPIDSEKLINLIKYRLMT